MRMTSRITAMLTAAVLGIGFSTHAIAGGDKNAAKKEAVKSAAITMADAIKTAEEKVGGTAIEADVDRKSRDTFYYEVDVVTPEGVKTEVRIDMKTGEVVKIERDGNRRG